MLVSELVGIIPSSCFVIPYHYHSSLCTKQNARSRPKRGSGTSTPEPEMKGSGRKSPGAASNTSSSSDKSKNKVTHLVYKLKLVIGFSVVNQLSG